MCRIDTRAMTALGPVEARRVVCVTPVVQCHSVRNGTYPVPVGNSVSEGLAIASRRGPPSVALAVDVASPRPALGRFTPGACEVRLHTASRARWHRSTTNESGTVTAGTQPAAILVLGYPAVETGGLVRATLVHVRLRDSRAMPRGRLRGRRGSSVSYPRLTDCAARR